MVSRPEESRVVTDFLTRAAVEPSALLVEGELGIGKTTVWKSAVKEAQRRGFRVLAARAASSEAVLAYATVSDLLSDVDTTAISALPRPQRLALDRVLLRADADDMATDHRAVAAAFLSAVDLLAEQTPVLLAIDDLQWIDASSALAIGFAARRFTFPVGICFSVLTDEYGPWPLPGGVPDDVVRLRLQPLDMAGIHTVVRNRLGRSYPRPTLMRIFEVSGGNPLYALELARAMDDTRATGEDRLPGTLAELVRARIGGFDADTRKALLAAACLSSPTVALVARALDIAPADALRALEAAEAEGILGIDSGRLHFSHPLFTHGIYLGAKAGQRREMHRRLAGIVNEPELHARHLAKSSTEGDPPTLRALDTAAQSARVRGAPAAAAELLDLAIALGGDEPQRLTASARHHFDAGDTARAQAALERGLAMTDGGPLRAHALCLLAVIRLSSDSFVEAADLLVRALDDADEQEPLRAQILVTLSFALQNAGQHGGAMQTADEAVATAERIGQPHLLSQALSMRAMLRFIAGAGLDAADMRRALEMEDRRADTPVVMRPSAHNALLLGWTGELDRAAEEMRKVWQFCHERGAESDLVFLAPHRVMVEIWRGRLADATLVAEDTLERATQLGGDLPLFVALSSRAACAAYAGVESEARQQAHDALAASERCGSRALREWTRATLAFLEVSVGNHAAALTAVQPVLAELQTDSAATEIATPFIVAPDAGEAVIALARVTDAVPLIDALERNGRRLDRAWMLAMAARLRAMLFAARGDVDAACRFAHEAMREHDRLPMPFERARTQLLLGQLQRRRREKEVAAATIREALAVFDKLGTPLWADRARAELARVKVGPRQTTVLTPSERRVAELTAVGMTNRDIAAKLFISRKTVEVNLSRIYRKLGIHSRAELARVIAQSDPIR